MKTYIYKLKFTTPVHFGNNSLTNSTPTCLADTLFSAICIKWIEIFGNADELIENVKNDKCLFSDTFPYINNQLYLPKPITLIESKFKGNDTIDKKKMKRVKYIPIEKIKEYIDFLNDGKNIDFSFDIEYCQEELIKKASILRISQILEDGDSKNTEIYNISVYRFLDNCGLYFILRCEESLKQKIDIAIDSLSLSGLGGKRSLGYGKFNFKSLETNKFNTQLNDTSKYYMSLTTFLPKLEEIKSFDKDKSAYNLIQRGGFIESSEYANSSDRASKKKKPVVMFTSGSCFDIKFKGQILNVSNDENKHPVYKYGKPLFWGVKI